MLTSLELAEFIIARPVDSATQDAALVCVLDTLACLLAGSIEPDVSRLESTLSPAAAPGGFRGFHASSHYRAEDAALLYGTAAHILDFDDVSMLAICHPTAPVLAALLASRPWSSIRGTDLCDAVAIGTEVTIRLGQAIGLRHYALGFHSTSTLGVFGAAAAVARLRRLSVEQTLACLALAASVSSGVRRNFGSAIKALHVGIAAANALRAVHWACSGIQGPARDLFAENSILVTFSGDEQRAWPRGLRPGAPFALLDPGFERKRYPCCYMLHRIIAAGLKISRQGIRLEDIATALIEMPRGGSMPLVYPEPVTGKQALFSGPYALLAAIADGKIDFATFTDAAVSRAHLQAKMRCVTLTETGDALGTSADIGAAALTVCVKLNNGEVKTWVEATSPELAADELHSQELAAKWAQCLRRAAPDMAAHQVAGSFEMGLGLRELPSLQPWLDCLWPQIQPCQF